MQKWDAEDSHKFQVLTVTGASLGIAAGYYILMTYAIWYNGNIVEGIQIAFGFTTNKNYVRGWSNSAVVFAWSEF